MPKNQVASRNLFNYPRAFRGGYAATTLPTTGGSGVGSTIRAGDCWEISANVTITSSNGTIAARPGDLLLALVNNAGTTWGDFSLYPGNTAGAISFIRQVNGLTPNPSTGQLTLGASDITTGTLAIAQGGTGGSTAPAARTALGIGTAGTANTPAAGTAAAAEVVLGSDTRLSDARTPTAHTHDAADLTTGTLADVRLSANVTLNGATQTLTNKTISGNTNTFTNIPQAAVTGLASALAASQSPLVSGSVLVTVSQATAAVAYVLSNPALTPTSRVLASLAYRGDAFDNPGDDMDAIQVTAGSAQAGSCVVRLSSISSRLELLGSFLVNFMIFN